MQLIFQSMVASILPSRETIVDLHFLFSTKNAKAFRQKPCWTSNLDAEQNFSGDGAWMQIAFFIYVVETYTFRTVRN